MSKDTIIWNIVWSYIQVSVGGAETEAFARACHNFDVTFALWKNLGRVTMPVAMPPSATISKGNFIWSWSGKKVTASDRISHVPGGDVEATWETRGGLSKDDWCGLNDLEFADRYGTRLSTRHQLLSRMQPFISSSNKCRQVGRVREFGSLKYNSSMANICPLLELVQELKHIIRRPG